MIKAPITLALATAPTSSGSKLKAMMSNGSPSSNHVCGTKPYSTGNTTDDGIILSRTRTSHSMLYSYLSLELLITSMTMLSSSGGLSPAGMSFQKFMVYFHLRKEMQLADLSFLIKNEG